MNFKITSMVLLTESVWQNLWTVSWILIDSKAPMVKFTLVVCMLKWILVGNMAILKHVSCCLKARGRGRLFGWCQLVMTGILTDIIERLETPIDLASISCVIVFSSLHTLIVFVIIHTYLLIVECEGFFTFSIIMLLNQNVKSIW